MAIDLFVQRGAGDRPGADIVDGLIGSLPVAIARGTAELDERGQAMREDDLETVYRAGVRPGQIVRVNDALHGGFNAKNAGLAITVRGGRFTSTLKLKRAA